MSYTRTTENFWDSGTTDTFAIPTGGYVGTYLTSILRVEVGGTLKTITTDYTIPAGTHVVLNAAVDCSVTPVRIYRESMALAQPVVSFPDATALNAKKHLNKSHTYFQWCLEELKDILAKTVSAVVSGSSLVWDMLGYKITNVGQGTSATDAARISDITSMTSSVEAYADAAVAVEAGLRSAADATEVINRNAAIAAEALIRSNADSSEANTRLLADQAEALARSSADLAEAGLRAAADTSEYNARIAADLSEANLRAAGDTNVYQLAVAYVQAWIPTISYLVSAVSDLVIPSDQPLFLGQTRVYFPTKVTDILVFIGGLLQNVTNDYTRGGLNANYIDLKTSVATLPQRLYALLFSSKLNDTTLFSQEDVSASAGDTVITFSDVFDLGLIFLNGVLQEETTDYTHNVGDDFVTFNSALATDSVVTRVVFLTANFDEETITVTAGNTLVTYTLPFDNSIVFIGGLCQKEIQDYTHVFGTQTLEFKTAFPVDTKVRRVMF